MVEHPDSGARPSKFPSQLCSFRGQLIALSPIHFPCLKNENGKQYFLELFEELNTLIQAKHLNNALRSRGTQ